MSASFYASCNVAVVAVGLTECLIKGVFINLMSWPEAQGRHQAPRSLGIPFFLTAGQLSLSGADSARGHLRLGCLGWHGLGRWQVAGRDIMSLPL